MGKSAAPSSISSAVAPGKPRASASAEPPDLRLEQLLWEHGVELIAGIDEAGRGAWAGPVVAAAVILPRDASHLIKSVTESPASIQARDGFVGVHDSKQLTAPQREAAARLVREIAVAVGVGVVPPIVVDEMGLSLAGQLAFWRAVENLHVQPEHLLVDGFPLWAQRFAQTAVIHGDARCLSIAAASVIAKVTRDAIMADLDVESPGYGFCSNRGYGTQRHAAALRELGPTAHHRRSYAPVSKCLLPSVDV